MDKLLKYLYGIALLMLMLVLWTIRSLPDGLLRVYYLNIGQGDSILIHTPFDQYILVDGGPDDTVLNELGSIMPFYKRKIDVVVLSHPHADHLNGLIPVLERYDVDQIIMSGVSYHYTGYDAFLTLINKRRIPVSFAVNYRDYSFGNIVLDVVYPLRSMQGSTLENVNNSSVSFRLMYGTHHWYFAGDLEMESEEILLKSDQDLSADVYKASHHGSRTSSTSALLDAIQPEYAVISCGIDNRFRHPHPETIKKLQERHVTIYRTDLDGQIEVVSDGANVRVKS